MTDERDQPPVDDEAADDPTGTAAPVEHGGDEAPDEHVVPPVGGLGRGIVVLLGSQVTTWVLSIAVLILGSRLLGPVGVGQLRIGQSLWAIMAVFVVFGTSTYLTVEVARHREQARPLEAAVTRARLRLFTLSLPIVAAISLIFGYDGTVLVIIAILAVFTLFETISTSARASLFGLEAMGSVARADVLGEVIASVAVLAVLIAGGGPVAVAVAMALAALALALITRRILFRVTKPVSTPPMARGAAVLRASRGYLFADAMIVVYLQVDTIVISLIATEEEIGFYSTADMIFASLLFVPTVLLSAVFPRMARTHHERPEDLRDQFQQAFSTVLVAAVWIGLGTFVVADSLVATLFGSQYEGSGPVLATFGIVLMLAYMTILLGQYAQASNRARYVGFLLLLSSIVSIPLDLVLVSWTRDRYDNGAIGAAGAYIVTEGLQVVLGIALLTPFLVSRRTGGRLLRCAVAGAVMVLVTWPLRSMSFVLVIPLASVVYFAVHLLLRTFDDVEKDAMRRSWAKVRGRLRRAPAG